MEARTLGPRTLKITVSTVSGRPLGAPEIIDHSKRSRSPKVTANRPLENATTKKHEEESGCQPKAKCLATPAHKPILVLRTSHHGPDRLLLPRSASNCRWSTARW